MEKWNDDLWSALIFNYVTFVLDTLGFQYCPATRFSALDEAPPKWCTQASKIKKLKRPPKNSIDRVFCLRGKQAKK